MSTARLAVIAVGAATLLTGYGVPSSSYRADAYDLLEIPADAGPYADPLVGRLVWPTSDATDVVQFQLEDGGLRDHPVQLAQEVLRLVEDHAAGADQRYLAAARRHADRLIAIGVDVDGALFFPYRFDFVLHGNPTDVMHAPWYSAMAQGQALSAFVALYAATGEPGYRRAADATFASFLDSGDPRGGGPWVTFVDSDGYLWLEEYAKGPPMQVLNGHIFATFGLYDYARLTDEPPARRLFDAAVTTVRRYGEAFRHPGGLSSYCLRWHVTSEKYHFVHVNQLRTLSAMTGDRWFAGLADRLAGDYSVDPNARSPALMRPAPDRSPSPLR